MSESPTMLRIVDWDAYFENKRTLRVKSRGFVLLPTALNGERISELIDECGAAGYGVWVGMVTLAASERRTRGCFVSRTGRPYDAKSIARKLRMEREDVEKTIEMALEIGMLERVAPNELYANHEPHEGDPERPHDAHASAHEDPLCADGRADGPRERTPAHNGALGEGGRGRGGEDLEAKNNSARAAGVGGGTGEDAALPLAGGGAAAPPPPPLKRAKPASTRSPSWPAREVEAIRMAFPWQADPKATSDQIKKSLTQIYNGNKGDKWTTADCWGWLMDRVKRYAQSKKAEAGRAMIELGETPKSPQYWFKDGKWAEDEAVWDLLLQREREALERVKPGSTNSTGPRTAGDLSLSELTGNTEQPREDSDAA